DGERSHSNGIAHDEAAVPVTQENGDIRSAEIGDGEIQLSVPIEIADGDATREYPNGNGRRIRRDEGAITVPQEDRDGPVALVRHREIEFPIAIKIADR